MHGTFRSDLGESGPSWQPPFVSSAPSRTKNSPLPERSEYGARRTNWPLIGFILAAHGVLLTALIMCDVIPIHKPKPAPTVITLMELQAPPPPEQPAEKVPEVRKVTPQVVAPVQIVQTPSPAPQIAVVRVAPPAPPVIAPPIAPGPVSVGDLGSKMITLVTPRYPMESRRRKEQGTVYLLVLLGIDGSVADVHVSRSSGYDRLDRAALDAVRKWRWSPTIRNGEAVQVQGTVDIPFTLTA